MTNLQRTFNELLSGNSTDIAKIGSLAKLKKQYSEVEVKSKLMECIEHAQDMLNVPQLSNRPEKQRQFLSSWILKEYYFYNFADIIKIIENGITGKYGKTYNRLDVEIISEWFNCYEAERINEIEENAKNQPKEDIEVHPDVKDKWQQIRKNLEAKLTEQKIQDAKRYNDLEGWCEEYRINYREAMEVISKYVLDRYNVYKIKASDVSFNHWHEHCLKKIIRRVHNCGNLDELAQLSDSLTTQY